MNDDLIIGYNYCSDNGCEKCNALDGKFCETLDDFEALRPHPNCDCTAEPVYKEDCDCSDHIDYIDELIGDINSVKNDLYAFKDDIINKILEYDGIDNNKMERLLNDLKSLLNPIGVAIETALIFNRNLKELRAKKDGSVDKYYHAKANCEAAQKGIVGSAVAKILSDAKEAYDELCGTLKTNSSKAKNILDDLDICRSSGADPEDQIANDYGRTKGRAYPTEDCSDLVKDVDKLFN